MIIYLDVPGTGMKDRVEGERDGTNVVTPNKRSVSQRNVKFAKKEAQPGDLGSGMGQTSVFSLSGRPCNCGLFLGTPRDRIKIQEDTIAAGGAAI